MLSQSLTLLKLLCNTRILLAEKNYNLNVKDVPSVAQVVFKTSEWCAYSYCVTWGLHTDHFIFLSLKQLQSMEESAEILRERSLKFYKGCRKYTYAPKLYIYLTGGL